MTVVEVITSYLSKDDECEFLKVVKIHLAFPKHHHNHFEYRILVYLMRNGDAFIKVIGIIV